MNERDYEAARLAFAQAYGLRNAPNILYNLALAEIGAGQPVLAARHLSEHMRRFPDTSKEDRENLLQNLRQEEAKVGRFAFQVTPRGATVAVDGEKIANAPLDHVWYVEPGEHTVSVSHPGFAPQKRTVAVSAGRQILVPIDLDEEEPNPGVAAPRAASPLVAPPQATVPPPAPPRAADGVTRGDSVSPVAVGVLIGGGVLTIASGIGWYVASRSEREAKDDIGTLRAEAHQLTDGRANSCSSAAPAPVAACSRLNNRLSDASRAQTWRNITGIATIGFATATVGAAVYTVIVQPRRDTARMSATPWAAHDSAGVLIRGAF